MKRQANELRAALEIEPRLRRIGEDRASASPDGGWCVKEILGHLIDSAANNHHRLVRLQLDASSDFPAYRQDDWVRLQQYQSESWDHLVDLWLAYNRHLARVIEHLDPASLGNRWLSPEGEVTLESLVVDYLHHLHHHLDQIFDRYDPVEE
jgi:hypothetical protein